MCSPRSKRQWRLASSGKWPRGLAVPVRVTADSNKQRSRPRPWVAGNSLEVVEAAVAAVAAAAAVVAAVVDLHNRFEVSMH